MLLLLAHLHIVIDPKLRMPKRHQVGHALHRQERLKLLFGGHRSEIRDAAVVPIRLQVNGVATQQNRSRLGKVNEQGVMAGSVPRRGDDHYSAVTEHVQILLYQCNRVIFREPGSRVPGGNCEGLRWRRRSTRFRRPEVKVKLRLLNDDGCVREQFNIADVCGVGVGNADGAYIGGRDANLAKLRDERLGPGPEDISRRVVRWEPAVWQGGDMVGDTGVPQKVALSVVDQVAVNGDVDRLSDVEARRPAGRLIGRVPPAAVEYIEPVDTLGLRLPPSRAAQEKAC